jgi:phosphohistidine phosphatase
MKKLVLMRHAKSSWDDPDLEDHERPLTARGRKAATQIAKYLEDSRLAPTIVLCTTAARARETLELIRPALGDSATVKIEPKLYGAGSKELLARIRRVSQAAPSALVIGHNPAIQDLVLELVPDAPLADQIRRKFPTAAVATLHIRVGEWRNVAPAKASLVEFVTPKGLRKSS